MRNGFLLSAAAVLVLAVTPAAAQPVEDEWWIAIDYDLTLVPSLSGGSGFNDGTGEFGTPWYYYENTVWWNEWFYNAPYDPDRWKVIDFGFDIVPMDPALDSYFEVVVNWSTPEWSALGLDRPPLPGDEPELDYIGRSEPFIQSHFIDPAGETFAFTHIIPDYNPEWVSIDLWGWNLWITDGYFYHECVPEPGAWSLLALAGLLALRRR
jgi:hypothetical protein